jgi:CheY-like chemotaxis protein
VARILVVDDDADVRKVITYGLSPTHQVVTARNGAEAIATIKGGDRFDVILSDVMMPELDGEGLYLELLEFSPEQARRIAFMSGGGGPAEMLRLASDRPFLKKPFEMSRLRALVADVLERCGPTR